MRSVKLLISVAMLSLATAAAAQADGWGPATPNFNLEAILRPTAGGPDGGFGHVKFRQPKDDAKIIYLDTWVRDLAPNHTYFLQRAVDVTVDDDCTAAVGWATLGEIPTDDSGTGRAALSRNVSMIPTGMEFDIHFRVVPDAAGSTTTLQSACYQYVVSQ
jgi:hypothetical protein